MKQIIWSSEDRLDDNARERYQEFQREVQDDNITLSVMKNGRTRCTAIWMTNGIT